MTHLHGYSLCHGTMMWKWCQLITSSSGLLHTLTDISVVMKLLRVSTKAAARGLSGVFEFSDGPDSNPILTFPRDAL